MHAPGLARLLWGAFLPLAALFSAASDIHDNLASIHGRVMPRPNTVFVRNGQTSRSEVVERLKAFDTEASTADFFWARWEQFRLPKVRNTRPAAQNFFVEFGSDGIATSWGLYSDAEVLDKLWRAAIPSENINVVHFIKAWYWNSAGYLKGRPTQGAVTIEKGQVWFEDSGNAGRGFRIPLALLTRITSEDESSDEALHLSLRFADAAKPVRRIKIEASPIHVIQLMTLLKAAGVQHAITR